MRIAFTYNLINNTVWPHFGETPHFMLVELESGNRTILTNGGYSHKDLVPYLKELSVDVLICGGLGVNACNLLCESGIKVIPGITGDINDVLDLYKKGQLIGDDKFIHQCSCGCNHG